MRKPTLLALVAAFAAAGVHAQAATIRLTPGIGKNVSIVYTPDGSGPMGVYAGSLQAELTGAPSGYAGSFDAYCVDLDHSISLPTAYEAMPSTTDMLTNGAGAAWLYNHFGPTANSPDAAAALQVSIWDLIADGGDGLAVGRLQYPAQDGVLALATGYLMEWGGQRTSVASWLEPTRGGQGMMGPRRYTSVPGEVPEPGIVSLLGASLVGVTVLRGRRRS